MGLFFGSKDKAYWDKQIMYLNNRLASAQQSLARHQGELKRASAVNKSIAQNLIANDKADIARVKAEIANAKIERKNAPK